MTKWQIHLSTAKNNLAHVWQTGLIIQVPENSPVAGACIIIGFIQMLQKMMLTLDAMNMIAIMLLPDIGAV